MQHVSLIRAKRPTWFFSLRPFWSPCRCVEDFSSIRPGVPWPWLVWIWWTQIRHQGCQIPPPYRYPSLLKLESTASVKWPMKKNCPIFSTRAGKIFINPSIKETQRMGIQTTRDGLPFFHEQNPRILRSEWKICRLSEDGECLMPTLKDLKLATRLGSGGGDDLEPYRSRLPANQSWPSTPHWFGIY